MRVKETILGNGLSRLDVEPMFESEKHIPTSVVDEIMRDIIRRKSNRNENQINTFDEMEKPFLFKEEPKHCKCHEHGICEPREMREPDGIDVHVDRPLRNSFCSYDEWVDALGKYRKLEQVAKDCDWECREPMKGLECDNRMSEIEEDDDFEFEDDETSFDEDELLVDEFVRTILKFERNLFI